jgi:nucleotide-binding universal stress UspA family protein
MLVNPLILVKDARGILVAVVIIIAEIISKFLPAWLTAKIFHWKTSSTMVMFGLSVAQAASTLAAITVAFNIKLVDEVIVNAIIGMILVSCVMSPWITERGGRKLGQELANAGSSKTEELDKFTAGNLTSRVLVPVANPSTEDNLLNLAIILTKQSEGTLLPLHVIISDKNGSARIAAKTQQKRLLDTAETLAHAAVTSVEPIGRIDDAIDLGILRAAQERDASLVICGWKGYSTYQENFFGSVIDNIVRRATTPLIITRFPQPIENTQRVFVAVSDQIIATHKVRQTLSLASILAEALKAPLEVLQVLPERKANIPDVELLVSNTEISIQRVQGNSIKKISEALKANDLLILLEITHSFGQSALGKQPEAIARSHPGISMIIMHFPD